MNFCAIAAYAGYTMSGCKDPITHEVESLFVSHIAEWGLSYATSEEYTYRLQLFAAADNNVKRVNSDPESLWTAGHNMFSTLSKDELDEYKGYSGPQEFDQYDEFLEVLPEDQVAAGGIDWRSKGYVNGVKTQGACQSCWAFAATAVSEAYHKKTSGKLLDLAEQMALDCRDGGPSCKPG